MNNYFFKLNQNSSCFFLIAGPCVIETEDIVLQTATKLADITKELGIPFIFKASFDKANRTSIDSFRGPGFENGLDILNNIKTKLNIPVISDIHLPEQADSAAKILDIIQIPALLSRQTDLIVAACKTGKPVSIKKGQFMAPQDCRNVIKKAHSTGNYDICITERGSSFGYQNLVVDFRSIKILRDLGIPVVFDATHSVQLPGKDKDKSAGDKQFIPTLARAAIATGTHGLFMETHPDPEKALCDGPNSWPLHKMKPLLQNLLAIQKAVWSSGENYNVQ